MWQLLCTASPRYCLVVLDMASGALHVAEIYPSVLLLGQAEWRQGTCWLFPWHMNLDSGGGFQFVVLVNHRVSK